MRKVWLRVRNTNNIYNITIIDYELFESYCRLLCLCTVAGCTSSVSQQETVKGVEGMSQSEAVVKTIMERRSIRKYKPQPVEREKMQTIVECGVNAPNAMNRQPWEIRVVDNPDFINGVTELYKKEQPKAAEDPNFKNMFRNAPTVVL